jgi:hypothetical protein
MNNIPLQTRGRIASFLPMNKQMELALASKSGLRQSQLLGIRIDEPVSMTRFLKDILPNNSQNLSLAIRRLHYDIFEHDLFPSNVKLEPNVPRLPFSVVIEELVCDERMLHSKIPIIVKQFDAQGIRIQKLTFFDSTPPMSGNVFTTLDGLSAIMASIVGYGIPVVDFLYSLTATDSLNWAEPMSALLEKYPRLHIQLTCEALQHLSVVLTTTQPRLWVGRILLNSLNIFRTAENDLVSFLDGYYGQQRWRQPRPVDILLESDDDMWDFSPFNKGAFANMFQLHLRFPLLRFVFVRIRLHVQLLLPVGYTVTQLASSLLSHPWGQSLHVQTVILEPSASHAFSAQKIHTRLSFTDLEYFPDPVDNHLVINWLVPMHQDQMRAKVTPFFFNGDVSGEAALSNLIRFNIPMNRIKVNISVRELYNMYENGFFEGLRRIKTLVVALGDDGDGEATVYYVRTLADVETTVQKLLKLIHASKTTLDNMYFSDTTLRFVCRGDDESLAATDSELIRNLFAPLHNRFIVQFENENGEVRNVL